MIALKYNVQRVIFPGYSQEWYPVIHKLCTYHPFWATIFALCHRTVVLSVCLAYLHAKFNLDPSNHLATIDQRHRQDRQRSDSVGRTVLQTVAQKG